MANRVTVGEVKEIITIDSTITDAEVEVFIKSANILTSLVNTVGGMTDSDQLMEVERWLSAHLVAIRDMRVASEKAGEVSQKFQYKVDLNFNVTVYGQTALVLDTSGYLAELQDKAKNGKKIAASILTLGTDEKNYPTDAALED